jgi:peptidyl-prolyl cis-trans isomerase C
MRIPLWKACALAAGWTLILLYPGCATKEPQGEIVATVDKASLTMEDFKAGFTTEQWKSLTAEQKKAYVQQWVNITLLAAEADKEGMGDETAIRLKIKYAEQKIKANALIASRLASQKVSEEDLFNYYRVHQGEFTAALMNYKVQRIYVTDMAMANKVKAEILQGMRFEDAVRVYSQETLGQTGGFMGTVTSADPDSSFWLAVRQAKLFDLVTLPHNEGVFILRPYAEEPGVNETGFEASKNEIRRRILDERKQQVYDDLLKELKSKSEVYLMI